MVRSVASLVVAACAAWSAAGVPEARAQGTEPGRVSWSAAATGVQQFSSDFDRGGSMEWSRGAFSAGVTRQFVPAFWAGVSVKYDYEAWRFSSPPAFGGQAPWERLQRPGVSVNLGLALSRTLLVAVTPALEWAYDSEADAGDGLIYGAVVSSAKLFSPGLTLGAGASVFRQFYSVKTSPFIIVNWKLNDRFRIANSFPAGPEGGAGVELRYAFSGDWELAGGGVYRSDRWQLADGGLYAGGVGETQAIPMFLRLSRKLGTMSRLDLYAGALTNGRLSVKDSDGKELAADNYEVAPAIAATLSLKL